MARSALSMAKWSALALGALVLLVLLAVPLLRSERVLSELTDRVLPKVSSSLGREVTVAGASIELFPRVQLALRGVEVAGGQGEPALLRAETATAQPKLWRLIRSFGKDLQINGLHLEDAQIALVKRPDGEWSYEDLGSEGNAAPAQRPASQQTTPTGEVVSDEASLQWALRDLVLTDAEITMIDRSEAPAKALRLPGVDLRMKEVAFDRPLVGTVTGELGGSRKNLEGEFRLDRLPPTFDGLAPEQHPRLSGALRFEEVPLEVLRSYLPSGFSELVQGGAVSGEATLSSAPGGEWVMEGPLRIDQMALRGEAASAQTQLRMLLPMWNPDAFVVQLSGLTVKGPGLDLGGSVRVNGLPLEVTFALEGDLLDLDALLAALPGAPAETGTGGGGPVANERAEATRPEEADLPPEELLSASARETLRTTAAKGTLRLRRVVQGKLQVEALEARATLQGGVLRFEEAAGDFFGGRMQLSGTTIDVARPTPSWKLTAGLEGVDLGAALAAVGGAAAVEGRAEGQLTLSGQGNDWEALRETAVGQGRMRIAEGALPALPLGSEVGQSLSALVPGGKLQGLADRAEGTKLKDLAASFQVKDGWLLLTRPLAVETKFGTARLGGRIGLDQRLDLEGTVALTPQFVSQVSGGRLRPTRDVPVPLEVGGTLKAPALQTEAPREALRGAVEEKVKERVTDELRDRARELLPFGR